jgi:cyclopropane fatty-acyl-phospholipid synthase-like methyltransferase
VLRRLFFQYSYFRRPPWDTGISPPELFEYIGSHKPGRAIDIGCGTGTNVITLARAGWQVTGVDFAPRAIRLARQKLLMAGVQAQVQVNDATKLKGIYGPFDLVLDLGCFHGISSEGRIRYLQQLQRTLAPNGFWLMYGFVRPAADHSSTGLTEGDIENISSRLKLLSRQEGFDDKRGRSSAWFLFQKKTIPASSV